MSLINNMMNFIHVAAVVFWIGGISYILFVLMPAVPNVALRDRARFSPVILLRFLVVVWVSAGLLVITGLHRIFAVWNVTEASFWGTALGGTLAAKLVLVAVLIGIAGVVTFQTVPRARAHVKTHEGEACDAYQCGQCKRIVGGMRRILYLGLAVALVIIYLATRLGGA